MILEHIGKWLKDQFETPKEKIQWRFIDIKQIGYNIAGTNISINNKDKSYSTFISNTLAIRWYQTMVITITITTRIIVIKFPIKDQERNK